MQKKRDKNAKKDNNSKNIYTKKKVETKISKNHEKRAEMQKIGNKKDRGCIL